MAAVALLVPGAVAWRLRCGAAAFALGVLAGCGALGVRPADPPGARIVEKNVVQSPGVAQIFYVAAIDGVATTSSLDATRQASSGRAVLSVQEVAHAVPSRPLRLTLAGTHLAATAAQEAARRARGDFLQVRGDVAFTPQPGGEYFVAGELKETGSSLWIADLATGQRVSGRVTSAAR